MEEPGDLPSAPPSARLQGLTLEGGWTVERMIERRADATGGYFSHSYQVAGLGNTRGFLKALDFSGALTTSDPARALEAMTRAFNWERDLLNRCRERRMTRVVRAIDSGTVRVDATNPIGTVQYIVFELADGDVRSALAAADRLDIAWRLRCLHNVATGLFQLHQAGVTHQDLKPSNVLTFGPKLAKIGDLGRAAVHGAPAPHDDFSCAGDLAYAPPELLYGHLDSDWALRRIGCDVYLFGSMVVFLFARSSMTALLLAGVPPELRFPNSRPPFEDVLPYLRSAFAMALSSFGSSVAEDIRDDLVNAVRELCDPDPRSRGNRHRPVRQMGKLTMERYISLFNRLATAAEHRLLPMR